MRVVHVINSLGASGGAEHGLVREITRFSSDVQQVVVRLFEKDQLSLSLNSAGIEVIPLGLDSASAGRNWPIGSRKLQTVVSSFGADVIHTSLFSANLIGQRAAARLDLPVVSTFTLSGDESLLRKHQPGASSQRAAFLRKVAGRAARKSSAHFRALTSDALVTNCRLLDVDPSRAQVIPRGVPDDLRPRPLKSRSDLRLPEDGHLLVNVGRHTRQKGHVFLLRALAQLRVSAPWHLAIIGREGDASAEIRREVDRLNLNDNVTIVGYTPDVYHYVAHATVFAFPSYMEGLGTSVVEAMALGAAVVAFDIPPVREVTGDGRFAHLTPIDDLSAFVSGVTSALGEDSERLRAAQRWVGDNFSIDKVSSRVEKLISGALAGDGAS